MRVTRGFSLGDSNGVAFIVYDITQHLPPISIENRLVGDSLRRRAGILRSDVKIGDQIECYERSEVAREL